MKDIDISSTLHLILDLDIQEKIHVMSVNS